MPATPPAGKPISEEGHPLVRHRASDAVGSKPSVWIDLPCLEYRGVTLKAEPSLKPDRRDAVSLVRLQRDGELDRSGLGVSFSGAKDVHEATSSSDGHAPGPEMIDGRAL